MYTYPIYHGLIFRLCRLQWCFSRALTHLRDNWHYSIKRATYIFCFRPSPYADCIKFRFTMIWLRGDHLENYYIIIIHYGRVSVPVYSSTRRETAQHANLGYQMEQVTIIVVVSLHKLLNTESSCRYLYSNLDIAYSLVIEVVLVILIGGPALDLGRE